jgi:hypothetical protein
MTDDDEIAEFRIWLQRHYGSDLEAPADVLAALLGRAKAKRTLMGWGSVYVMAANWLFRDADSRSLPRGGWR